VKRTLVLVVAACFLSLSASAQNVLTRKEIYRASCKSVVQIQTAGGGFGVGFIVSPDGLIMTANHVITTRDSKFREYAADIKVAVFGKPGLYQAKPINAQVSDDQANYDSAIIKIAASDLPAVTLGAWSGIDVPDPVTIITAWPGIGCIMLDGSVSAKVSFQTELGPKPVNTILFQSPVRNGFSGSPIFNAKGLVVGIVDTKVWGISAGLDEQRKRWQANASPNAPVNVVVRFGPGHGDVTASMLELINNLDQNLISGLGSGVDIAYAKEQQKAVAAKP